MRSGDVNHHLDRRSHMLLSAGCQTVGLQLVSLQAVSRQLVSLQTGRWRLLKGADEIGLSTSTIAMRAMAKSRLRSACEAF